MRKLLTCLFLLLSVLSYSQCFECKKNIGGWNGDGAAAIEKTVDGIVFLVNQGDFVAARIMKYDFNCNLIWSKSFGFYEISLRSVTSDEFGNIYLLIHNTSSTNGGLGPWNIDGFSMSPGLNFYKLSPSGTILWSRYIGPRIGYNMQNIVYHQNQLYVTGTFYDNLSFVNGPAFNFPYTDSPYAFIAKYDINGNLINAVSHGTGTEMFKFSEIDNLGNVYLAASTFNSQSCSLDKLDSSLQLSWSRIISSAPDTNAMGVYSPTGMHYNKENDKIYLWGRMNQSTTIMGHTFFISNMNGIFQSALTEFNTATGDLENIKRFDNNAYSSRDSMILYSDVTLAYMAERNGYLYVLTSFSDSMVFPNGTITSTPYHYGEYFSEELVLFKVKLSDFSSELILKSTGVPNLIQQVADLAGPIVFENDNLYLTASFESKPMTINGATINNNSGNSNSDAMLYKFNINATTNNGDITVQNSCATEVAQFGLSGNYDSVSWDFGDPASANNSASIPNPQHSFSSSGNFHITATVTCSGNTQTVTKDITISTRATINPVSPIQQCETISGSGISATFDTSNLEAALIGSQANVQVKYRDANGSLLPSPLPNPYTNTNRGGDTITARAYVTGNPDCYSETTIQFIALPRPSIPILTDPQTFCIQQNAVLSDIATGSTGIKWYDSQINGNLLLHSNPIADGTTYYAATSNANCESLRAPVTINIQNTAAPTGSGNQTFCSTQNATLTDITATRNSVIWYGSVSGSTPLANTTILTDGTTYYATQTINNCESTNRLAVTISLINTLNATDYSEIICDNSNDGSENINLPDYNAHLISNSANYTFAYYTSLSGATNQNSLELVASMANYPLTTGLHTFYIRIASANTCFQIVRLDLTLVNKPHPNIPDSLPLCEKNSITVDAGPGYTRYNWSTGSVAHSTSVTQAGNYSVVVTQNHGSTICSTTKNFNVVLSNTATITTIEAQDWTDYNNTIVVTATGLGDYEYSIDGLNYQNSNIFTGLNSGSYTVYVRDKNGCGITKEQVFLLIYPKFFTPNGDGHNDYWSVKFSQFEKGLTIAVYDRYGKILSSMNNLTPWDGTYNGKALPSDDYWFVVTRSNGKEYKGHFTLKR